MIRKFILVGLLLGNGWLLGATEKNAPVFSCSFENAKEISNLGGVFNEAKTEFVPGIKGQALKLPGNIPCKFPVEGVISSQAGTLSVWIKPDWKLPDINNPRLRLFSVINHKQQARPTYKNNYFCLLGLSYGNLKKGKPYILYTLARLDPEEQMLLLMPAVRWQPNNWQYIAIVWQIGTGYKDGELLVYLNGKLVERKTDLRALKLKLGDKFACRVNGVIDELKTWAMLIIKFIISRLCCICFR
jgi:hypothetical protein